MAVIYETPTCPFCGEIITEPVYNEQAELPSQLRLIGDNFIGWDYKEHGCKEKEEYFGNLIKEEDTCSKIEYVTSDEIIKKFGHLFTKEEIKQFKNIK